MFDPRELLVSAEEVKVDALRLPKTAGALFLERYLNPDQQAIFESAAARVNRGPKSELPPLDLATWFPPGRRVT